MLWSTQHVEYDEDVQDELEGEAELEWEVASEMDPYDAMLAAYAYDNEIFEWSFECVGATALVVVLEQQARGVPHLHALASDQNLLD